MYESITAENVMMYAIRHYNNPQCEGEKEFQDDLKRFKYIKRLLRKYHETGILKERLLLNHFIVLNNVFNNRGVHRAFKKIPLTVKKVPPRRVLGYNS